MGVRLKLNVPKLIKTIGKRMAKAQFALDQQVLKDTNFYVPKDSGQLEASAIKGTRLGSGKIIYNEPYAAYQFYTDNNKSKDQNPNASTEWFEVAKSKNVKKWDRIAQKGYEKA